MTTKINKIILSAFLSLSSVAFVANAQEVIEISPLFEYPTAPEELPTLEAKSDYLVEHFWDQMDFKSKTTVDQNALNDAFRVFSIPLRWASRDKAVAATDRLLQTISKNPVLLLQFTKAAEENIYGPRAEVWVDEVYLKFLNTIVKNKKVPSQRKKKYENQLNVLSKTLVGSVAPEFTFENLNGDKATYFPMATSTIIIFGNPKDADWRLSRLRMEANAALAQAVDKGKVNILFIIPENMEGWKQEVVGYSPKWTVGCGDDLKSVYDMRAIPSVYAIGPDGKILLKNTTLQTAINRVLEEVK